MKIKELYLASFGKFKDYRLTLAEDFNLLYGNNEDGKTTIMAFIRMMFYGCTARTGDLAKNPRKRYAPWDGSPMAGSVVFHADGTDYRLERVFLSSNSTDQITLTDLSTGETERYTADALGQRFFGLSAAAFDRSCFIGQAGAGEKDDQAEGELNARLSSLAQTGDEGVSVQKLLSNLLEGKEELMSRGGNKGRYDQGLKKLEALNEELLLSRKAGEEKQALMIKISNEKSRVVSAQKEADRYEAQLRAAENYRNLKKLNDFVEAGQALASLERKLKKADGSLLSSDDLSTAEQLTLDGKLALTRLEDTDKQRQMCEEERKQVEETLKQAMQDDARSSIDALTQQTNQLADEETRLVQQSDALRRQMEEQNARKSMVRPIFPILVLLGLAVAAAGFFLTSYALPCFAAGGALAVIGLLLSVLCRKKPAGAAPEQTQQRTLLEEQLQTTRTALSEQKARLASLTATACVRTAELENARRRDEELTKRCAELQTTGQELIALKKQALDGLCALFPNVTEQTSFSGIEIILHACKEAYQKGESLHTRLALLRHDLGEDMTVETALAQHRQISREENALGDPKTIRELLSFKQKEIAETQKELALDEARLATEFNHFRHPTELEHELARTRDVLLRQKAFCEAIDVACSQLTAAATRLRQNYGEQLEKRAGEIFSQLTGGAYTALHISRSFEIRVEKAGVFGTKEWQYLSSGTADQAYFSLRLAVSELLSEGSESTPLFLDDSFCQYDEGRQAVALAFLEDYGRRNQVLLFTCHTLPTSHEAIPLCKPPEATA